MSGDVSPITTAEAVAREGESWGLVAKVVGDKTKVCDVVTRLVVEGGCGVLEDYERQVCTVDGDHPFSAALGNRVGNGETDLAARARAADLIVKKAEAKRIADHDAETKAQWKSRRRIFAGPSGIIPAGLSNRNYRS